VTGIGGARPLPGRTLSRGVAGPAGQEVVKIEALPVQPGQTVRLRFERAASAWRQGVWLATEGSLSAGGTASPQLVIWADTAPPEVDLRIEDTDGLLRLYNVWDSDRGRGPFESQSATSGMLVEELDDGSRRYACNDIGTDPDFEKVIFSVAIMSSSKTD
jgi:hypothetical protein